jgi:cell wall-associated NlpC family hydrolase
MNRAKLRASLSIWRTRHKYRQRRLDLAHKRNDSKAIHHWHALLVEAGKAIALRRHQLAKLVTSPRQRIVHAAQQAAANYRRNPGAYHYLAGGVANTVIMRPTPRNWRSDCSQFAVACYREAGLSCPGTGSFMASNTGSIDAGGRVTYRPQPGDLGMYGRHRGYTHHVEVYIGDGKHIGHGTQPIDSRTPGRPDYYLTFL